MNKTPFRQSVLVSVLAISMTLGASNFGLAEMPRMSRGLFLTRTSFGSLAWIPSAVTDDEDSAVAQDFVRDLSGAACFRLPARRTYWFMINHRSPEDANTAGFFAVEIVAQSSLAKGNYLSLLRNGGWLAYDGKKLPKRARAQYPQIGMSTDRFIDLHDDARTGATSDEERRNAINNAINDIWHALPDADRPGTWDYRSVFASRTHIAPGNGVNTQVSARLIKFTITGKPNSAKPAVFLVYRDDGANVFWIDIAGPSLPSVSETEFRIGTNCPSSER